MMYQTSFSSANLVVTGFTRNSDKNSLKNKVFPPISGLQGFLPLHHVNVLYFWFIRESDTVNRTLLQLF